MNSYCCVISSRTLVRCANQNVVDLDEAWTWAFRWREVNRQGKEIVKRMRKTSRLFEQLMSGIELEMELDETQRRKMEKIVLELDLSMMCAEDIVEENEGLMDITAVLAPYERHWNLKEKRVAHWIAQVPEENVADVEEEENMADEEQEGKMDN